MNTTRCIAKTAGGVRMRADEEGGATRRVGDKEGG
jgi:hypothetical protein